MIVAADIPVVLKAGDVRDVLVVPDPCKSLLLIMNWEASGVVNVSLPSLYPLALNVQAALATVPPVELFVNVQDAMDPLKLSNKGVPVNPEFDVAEELKLIELPLQILDELLDAVTAVGVGFTAKLLEAVADPQVPPVAVNVKVTVPVNEAAGV